MSNTAKIVISVLVVLALIALAFGTRSPWNDGGLPSGTDTSDQDLGEDTAAIDAELEGLEGDRAMIDQGLSEDVGTE